MRRFRHWWLLWLLWATACPGPESPIEISEPVHGAGTSRFRVRLDPQYVAGSLRAYLDGRSMGVFSERDGESAVLPLEASAGPGPHLLLVVADFQRQGRRVSRIASHLFSVPPGAPALVAASPKPGATGVSTAAWPRLDFADEISDELIETLELSCLRAPVDLRVTRRSSSRLIVNPDGQLPVGSTCTLAWRGPQGRETLSFRTAPQFSNAQVLYDRSDSSATAPFPDDFWTRSTRRSPTRLRLDIPIPMREDVAELFAPLLAEVNELDGFSPIAHIVVPLSHPADPASLPRSVAESLDPLSSVVLVDIHPDSPEHRQRVPFRLEVRSDASADGAGRHALLIFPSIPLRVGGRYGVLVSRRVHTAGRQSLQPSPSMAACLQRPQPGESPQIARARRLIRPLLRVAGRHLEPPIPPDDLALALRFTVGSLSHLTADMRAVREQVFSAPPPEYRVESVQAIEDRASPVLAVVRGRWEAPDWRDGSNWARDERRRPRQTGTSWIPFTLTLPRHALLWKVPVVMYQHGTPGSAEAEVTSPFVEHLSEAGFAVIGFTDVPNRRIEGPVQDPTAAITAQVFSLLLAILMNERVPDYWAQTTAEQLAFVRMIPTLGELDVMPLGAPDGRPEIQGAAPISYVGISEGANHASALLPYAPEIKASVLVAGGSRLSELLIHQEADAFLRTLPILFPGFRPVDVWVAFALFQTAFDRQDAHNHARHLYREPVELAYEPPGEIRRSSVLLVAGLDDNLVPNHATASLAWQLGPLPQLDPAARALSFLESAPGPIRGNIDPRTTAAFVQFVPQGVPGVAATPGCVPSAIGADHAGEGHFCAQLAEESLRQRANFLISALGNAVPSIGH